MLLRTLLCLLTCVTFTATEAGFWDKMQAQNSVWKPEQNMPPMIKVLIVHDEPGVVIEVKGKYKMYDPRTNDFISTRFIGKRKFMQGLKDGLRWGEEFPGMHQLLIIPDDIETTTIVDGIEYRGAMYIYDVGGSISVVNEVPIEDYLQSIMARQVLEAYDPEVLSAIAITARTNVYAQAMNPKSPFWAVDARNNGYEGNAVTQRNTGIERGIIATRFLIMGGPESKKNDTIPLVGTWGEGKEGKTISGQPVSAKITLAQANDLAKKGSHAAQILSKAFPDSSLVLMYSTSNKK